MQGQFISQENNAYPGFQLRFSDDLTRAVCTESWTSVMLRIPSRTSSTERKVQEWGGKFT